MKFEKYCQAEVYGRNEGKDRLGQIYKRQCNFKKKYGNYCGIHKESESV